MSPIPKIITVGHIESRKYSSSFAAAGGRKRGSSIHGQCLHPGVVLRWIIITPITGVTARISRLILSHITIVENTLSGIVSRNAEGSVHAEIGADVHPNQCANAEMTRPIIRVGGNLAKGPGIWIPLEGLRLGQNRRRKSCQSHPQAPCQNNAAARGGKNLERCAHEIKDSG
jgi:hypothetical protein